MKRIAVAAAILVGFAVLAAIVIPLVVDEDAFRPRVEEAISEATGRHVRLGEISMKIGLGVELQAAELEIGDPLVPSPDPEPTVHGKRVVLRIAVVPLLTGRIEVRKIRIGDAEVRQGGDVLASGLELDGRLDEVEDGRFRFRGDVTGAIEQLGGARVEVTFDATTYPDRIEIARLDARVAAAVLQAHGTVRGLASPVVEVDLEVDGTYGATVAAGRVGLRFPEERTEIEFDLHSPDVDIDDLKQTVGAVPAVALGRPAGLVSSAFARDEPGGSSHGTASVVARGVLTADRATNGPLELTAIRASIELDAGVLRVTDAGFDFYGGRHVGALEVEVDDPALPFVVTSRIDGVDVGAMVAAAAPEQAGTVSGQGTMQVELAGDAGSPDPSATVVGDATIAVVDGSLSNAGLMRQLSDALASAGAQSFGGDATPFDRVSATFAIADGRMRTDDLQLRSPDIDLDGDGVIALDGRLRLDVDATLSREVSNNLVRQVRELRYGVGDDGRLSIPMVIGGEVTAPVVTVDLKQLLERGLGKALGDSLRDLLGR